MSSVFRVAYAVFEPAAAVASVAADPTRRAKIGLALGSGVARGWCHIGVLQEFSKMGLRFDVIAGTSMGAVVGGCYAAGRLEQLEEFARSVTRRRMLSLIDVTFGGGLLGGSTLRQSLERALGGVVIESLPSAFAAVATELNTGNEIWLRQGSLSQALAASYAIPGLFEPVRYEGRLLVDGSLINPVPVAACRALGADIVIAIALVTDTMYRSGLASHQKKPDDAERAAEQKSTNLEGWRGRLTSPCALFKQYFWGGDNNAPGMISVMTDAFTIMHDRIARARLAGDPPDVLINARLENFGLFDFHRAEELIDLGRETAQRWAPELKQLMLAHADTDKALAQ